MPAADTDGLEAERRATKGGLAGWQVRALAKLVEESPHDLTVRRLAAAAGLGPHHFSRAFRATFRTSPRAWLVETRLRRAKDRLASGGATVEQIARELGYSSSSQLSRAFRARFGLSPKAFRRL